MSNENRDLYYLDELSDYKIASDYPDIRDWIVTDSGNRTIGRVDSLLVSKKAERVVYLDVDIDDSVIEDSNKDEVYEIPASEGAHEFLNADGDRHLIIPIGLVSLNEDNQTVWGEKLDYSSITSAKRFRKHAVIIPDDELALCRHYTGDHSLDATTLKSESFYNRPEFTHGSVHNQ